MSKRLIKPELSSGERINTPNPLISITNFSHPIFCFKHIHKKYGLDKCTPKEKVSFVEQLIKLSSENWSNLQLAPKNGLGCEKIKRKSIKAPIPGTITDDIDFFLSFRFHGKMPFVGFRNKFIFHIVYIDKEFTVYNHS